jgi:hypothetical protein
MRGTPAVMIFELMLAFETHRLMEAEITVRINAFLDRGTNEDSSKTFGQKTCENAITKTH